MPPFQLSFSPSSVRNVFMLFSGNVSRDLGEVKAKIRRTVFTPFTPTLSHIENELSPGVT